MQTYQIDCTPTNIATNEEDRPAIHVALAAGLSKTFFNWVAIGAEEEGVPCRQVKPDGDNAVAIAYQAALSSRFGVGIGIAGNTIVVHQLHMPPHQPVLNFDGAEDFIPYCRLAGTNAARFIVRLPFRFNLETLSDAAKYKKPAVAPLTKTDTPAINSVATDNTPADIDPAMVKAIAEIVAKLVNERGLL